ncbi:hypothetical protein RFI_12072 [Reticulomyxa filosa]|uniref:PCI domain-containing protein n=1 Tax=Reticulomyxa filosa TaxID=46433 RepID=X6NGE7_RETFI|nr:hypothetical protein RFI_12072 [Reticulomyxa filosa]|eukprot:ETO25071.1 hypothetical protein RFI_12072 [Reticulomyxa filosa]
MNARSWLMHHSLFVFFNKAETLDVLIEFFMSDSFINCIQTMAPYLLRYLTVAILISEKDRNSKMKYLNDVSRFIAEEEYAFKDPITEFIRLLIRTNDFDGASKMLEKSIQIIQRDFFLWYYQEYFKEYARLVFFKKYCRLYSRIDVNNLAKLLLMKDEMTTDKIQSWIINAVRTEEIDARLDVVKNVVHINFSDTNAYQLTVERTRAMNARTIELVRQLYDRFPK